MVSSYGSREVPDFVLDEISGNDPLVSEPDHIRIRGFLTEMEDSPCYSDSRNGSGDQNGIGVIAYLNITSNF